MQSQPGVGSRTEEPCRQLRACVLAQCPDAALVNQHKSFPKRTKDERIARAAGRTDENMAPRLPDELAQLRALLPQVLSLIRSRRAALEAEFADLGGHAPAAANSTEPSATGLGCEESPALQQLIRRTLSDWYRERSAFEAAIVGAREFDCAGKYYYQQFLAPEEASALMECLVAERPPYMVKFNEAWRSTVATRPKCNMAQPVDGAWPAYKWGQVADDLPLIELPPRLVQDLARRLEEHFGHPRGFLNSPMATYYYDGKHQYLVCHQDKAHSCESTGQIETAAPIYNLSLGAPRNFVIADLNSLGKFRRVDMRIYADIRMNSGDLVVLSPEMSARFCHGVPEDPDAPAALRISLVFRHCTKYWIRQLPDKTWEQCRRGADGQDGPWKPLIGPKDGESDDREARLTERRRIAAAKLSNQHTQKRGKRKRSTSSQPPGAPAPQAARRRVTGGCSAGTGGDKSRPVTASAPILSERLLEGAPPVLRFLGKSGCSEASVTLRRGTLCPPAFDSLRAAFATELSTELPESRNTPGEYERFFRLNSLAPALKTNGGRFTELASQPAVEWLRRLRVMNAPFYDAFKPLADATFHTKAGQKPAWETKDPADSIFAYACIVRRHGAVGDSKGDEGWHVDGGASTDFLAISLAGERIVEFQEADGRRHQLHLRPGDFYLSSPACIRHRVVHVDGPSTTLLLRSAVLTRRHSENRVFGTRACFERLAREVAEVIATQPFEFDVCRAPPPGTDGQRRERPRFEVRPE